MATTQISADKVKATRLAGGKRKFSIDQGVDASKAYAIEQAVEEVENRVLARIEQGLAQRITTAAPAEE